MVITTDKILTANLKYDSTRLNFFTFLAFDLMLHIVSINITAKSRTYAPIRQYIAISPARVSFFKSPVQSM